MQSLLPLAIYSQSFSNELKKNHFFKAVFFFLFKYTTLRCLYFKAAVLGVLSFCAYVFVEELQIFIALYGFSSFFFLFTIFLYINRCKRFSKFTRALFLYRTSVPFLKEAWELSQVDEVVILSKVVHFYLFVSFLCQRTYTHAAVNFLRSKLCCYNQEWIYNTVLKYWIKIRHLTICSILGLQRL